jgi:hypothetical protein
MALPTTGPYGSPTLDDFNRAGTTSPPSGSWTTAFNPGNTALALSNDTATVKASAAGFNDGYWNPSTPGPDSEVWAVPTVLATGTEELFAIYLRGTPGASATAYEVAVKANALTAAVVQRENNPSTFPVLGTATLSASFAVNDGLALVSFGNASPVSLEVWFWDDSTGLDTWVKQGASISDDFSITPPGSNAPYLAAGRLALEMQNTTSRVTVFGGGTVSVGPPPLPPPPALPVAQMVGARTMY